MKKIFAFAAVALLAFGSVFAQDEAVSLEEEVVVEDQNSTKIIMLEDTPEYKELHPKAKNVTLRLDYTPLTGEAIFTYSCLRSGYDQGEAMNVAMAVYQNFAEQNKFKRYRYADKKKGSTGLEKSFKSEKGFPMMSYSSRVIFSK